MNLVGQYEEMVSDLQDEIAVVKEQMMAQRMMLKDAIHHGHHLQAKLDEHQKRESLSSLQNK